MYKLPKSHFWHGRIDSKTDRHSFYFHQAVEFLGTDEVPAEGSPFAILGFECDEGVRRLGGNPGLQKLRTKSAATLQISLTTSATARQSMSVP
ncbi:hypothetical protein [Planococcus sp. 107-1]|uniref:hypothetical protein n=1 Tax=Planococcus sp. 107-1 TaxID=2908840 RepID=UPI001F347982|nr:hypothetical protein [Planococcus sp. 107-1]UJF28597.1 hypothetical protein L0M13_03370 [Planococcus sp. 107-1]